MLFDGEEDGQRVERVDSRVGQLRVRCSWSAECCLFPSGRSRSAAARSRARHAAHDNVLVGDVALWTSWTEWTSTKTPYDAHVHLPRRGGRLPRLDRPLRDSFVALSGLEDPSRPTGRILSIEAGHRALASPRPRPRHHHVVHVARGRKGEEATLTAGSCSSTACRIRASRKRWWWSWGWRMGGCCGYETGDEPGRNEIENWN